jgi:hypothetical protein
MVLQEAIPRSPNEPYVFELPPDQSIPGCSYAAGFTYPDNCDDEHGNETFRAGVDPQSVLDKLKAAHGIKGPYNVVPPDYNFLDEPPSGREARTAAGVVAPIDSEDAQVEVGEGAEESAQPEINIDPSSYGEPARH